MEAKRYLIYAAAIAACAILATTPSPSPAATASATGTVNAGTLTLSTSATPSFSVNLDGTDRTGTYTLPSTVEDATGSGAGWNLTVTSTQFTTSSGPVRTLPTDASMITGVGNSCATGTCTAPSSAIGYNLAIPAGAGPPTAVKYYNAAANTGMGRFTNTPSVSVGVPANAYAGTYTSTLTISAVSGP
jgi:hypothetical protein